MLAIAVLACTPDPRPPSPAAPTWSATDDAITVRVGTTTWAVGEDGTLVDPASGLTVLRDGVWTELPAEDPDRVGLGGGRVVALDAFAARRGPW